LDGSDCDDRSDFSAPEPGHQPCRPGKSPRIITRAAIRAASVLPEVIFPTPEMTFGRPEMSFGRPKTSFVIPKVTFGTPKVTSGRGNMTFGMPKMTFPIPKVISLIPEMGFVIPTTTFTPRRRARYAPPPWPDHSGSSPACRFILWGLTVVWLTAEQPTLGHRGIRASRG
jgi:hypothetical protein